MYQQNGLDYVNGRFINEPDMTKVLSIHEQGLAQIESAHYT